MRSLRWISIGLLACAGLVVAPIGSAQEPRAGQAPTVIRSTTRLVQVNVVVRDKKGGFVTDLTRDDFELEDEGKRQKISMFAFQRSDETRTAAAPAQDVFSNRYPERAAAGGVTAILLDGLNTNWADQSTARHQVIRFLSQVQPDDRIALYTLGRRLQLLHDFTREPRILVEVLNAYVGRSGAELAASHQPSIEELAQSVIAQYGDTEEGRVAAEAIQGIINTLKEEEFYHQSVRVVSTFNALESIANHLSGIPGRKNLVWVSGSFPLKLGYFETEDASRGTSPETSDSPYSARYPSGRVARKTNPNVRLMIHGRSRTFDEEFQRAANALSGANISVYPVDARGLSPNPQAFQNISTMNDLARNTGGKAYYNTNDIMNSVREAVQDAKVSYTLAYYPSEQMMDGKFRRIKVRVRRPGLVMRHRLGYYDRAEASPAEGSEEEIRETVWSPLDATGVIMDARIEPAGSSQSDSLSVTATVDAAGITFSPSGGRWTGKLEFFIVQTDEKGEEYGTGSQTLSMDLLPQTYENTKKQGVTYRTTVERRKEATALRIVVRDIPSGNTGRVVIPYGEIGK